MIAILGLAGLTCFMLVSIGIGLRMIILATRTKQLPEALMGAALFLSGGLGLALGIVPVAVPSLPAETAHGMVLLSIILGTAGFCAFYVFVWLVFRRDSLWGRLLFGVCLSMLLVATAGELATREIGETTVGAEAKLSPFGLLGTLSRLIVYIWAAWESFAYHSMMKRRLALGLADKRLVSRFWYWGVSKFASSLIWVLELVGWRMAQSSTFNEIRIVVIALLGFVVAASLQQAFFSTRGAESELSNSEAGTQSSGAS